MFLVVMIMVVVMMTVSMSMLTPRIAPTVARVQPAHRGTTPLLLAVLPLLLFLMLLVLVLQGVRADRTHDAPEHGAQDAAADLVAEEAARAAPDQRRAETLLAVLAGALEAGAWRAAGT